MRDPFTLPLMRAKVFLGYRRGSQNMSAFRKSRDRGVPREDAVWAAFHKGMR